MNRGAISVAEKAAASVYVAGTTISKVTGSKKKMTVRWKKNTKVTGYQIRYSTTSDFSSGVKTVTISKKSTVKKVISKLTAKTTYYVQVRTYKTVSKVKYYSAWSATKSVKVK